MRIGSLAVVATIDLARDRSGNPPIPAWLRADYASAIQRLAELALSELPRATDQESIRSMLSILALWKGVRTYARVLVELSEDEVVELSARAAGDSDGVG